MEIIRQTGIKILLKSGIIAYNNMHVKKWQDVSGHWEELNVFNVK